MSAADSYRVLGIDPGLNITGYGVVEFRLGGVEKPAIIEAGAIRTDPKATLAERIAQIHADLSELLGEVRPDVAAVEQLYSHYKHPRTSILMAHARGVILLAAGQGGVSVRSISATEIKKSLTGNGHASKRQIQQAVRGIFNLQAVPEPPDVADALAIAICAGRRI